MDWDCKYLPETGVLSVTTHGVLDYELMLELIESTVAEMQKRGCERILIDHRNAVLQFSPTRMYRLPAVEIAYGVDRRQKVAVVLAPTSARPQDAQIYVDVMQTNGLPHRLFSDPEAALDWLLDRRADTPGPA